MSRCTPLQASLIARPVLRLSCWGGMRLPPGENFAPQPMRMLRCRSDEIDDDIYNNPFGMGYGVHTLNVELLLVMKRMP